MGTSSGTRVAFCSSSKATGSGRSVAGSQPVWLDGSARSRATSPCALRCSTFGCATFFGFSVIVAPIATNPPSLLAVVRSDAHELDAEALDRVQHTVEVSLVGDRPADDGDALLRLDLHALEGLRVAGAELAIHDKPIAHPGHAQHPDNARHRIPGRRGGSPG